jgi:transposase
MSQGGRTAVKADEDVVAATCLRDLEQRVRELECLLGRKTLEVELLKEALAVARKKSPPGSCRRRHGSGVRPE